MRRVVAYQTAQNRRGFTPMMNICGHRHDEIAFEGRHCPLCAALAEIERVQDELDDLRAAVNL